MKFKVILSIGLILTLMYIFGCAPTKPAKPSYELSLQNMVSDRYERTIDSFIIILDASGYMNEPLTGVSRLTYAKNLLTRMIRILDGMEVTGALRTFSSGSNITTDKMAYLHYGPSKLSTEHFLQSLEKITWKKGKSSLVVPAIATGDNADQYPGRVAVFLVSDGRFERNVSFEAVNSLKSRMGDRFCIYPIHITLGTWDEARLDKNREFLNSLVDLAGCGFVRDSHRIDNDEDLLKYVRNVFFTKTGERKTVTAERKAVEKKVSADSDSDGVSNELDACPDTPELIMVDSNGCPLDDDGDGVPYYVDECFDTPENVRVDNKGCPLPETMETAREEPVVPEEKTFADSDGDGVNDKMDACPDTPKLVMVDNKGCPLDDDNDGIPYYVDECFDTPAGEQVDERGCPTTVAMAAEEPKPEKTVAAKEPDKDGDGVPDSRDVCMNTPEDVMVDSSGCALDDDGDGVSYYLDECFDTPKGMPVDEFGCPKAMDDLGPSPEVVMQVVENEKEPPAVEEIPEAEMEAPPEPVMIAMEEPGEDIPEAEAQTETTPGPVMIAMEEPGEDIPEAEAQTETAPEPMMTTMEETGEAVEAPDLTGVIIGRLFFSPEAWEINPSYRNPVLEDVVEYLKKNRSIHILISAHATPYESDSMELSKLRARSVESYLVSKGIENSRLTTRANGTRHPAATNLSPVGQAYNRRVDFIEKSKGSH